MYTSPSINAYPKSTTYTFLFDILSKYNVVVKDSSIYETNNMIESLTLQNEIDGVISRATIIWSTTERPATVILQSSSYLRQYQINNINKDPITYSKTTELSISYSNLLVIYEQVNQFVFDENDIALNISRRLQYQRAIVDQMISELPSSYSKSTTDTNVYRFFRSIAAEFADASMRLTMVKEDNLIDNAREEALYHNFGTLIKLEKQSNWSYEKYRRLIKGILASLFKGPTTASVATALQLFTNFKVSISELYKLNVQKKYADLLNYYNPTFTFIIELEKPLDDNTYTQQELIEDNTYILQLTKPAHTIGILIIVLVSKENWATYYKEKYDKDWIYNDESNINVDFSKLLDENTYGWKAISDPGTFNISPHENNGIYSNNSLLNGGMVIGPRYTLFDTSHLHAENSIKDIYYNNKLKEQLIQTIGIGANEKYIQYKENLYEISAALIEPRFGFINNHYMQLSGNNIIDKVLNQHLIHGIQTKLHDDLLIQQQQFFNDKYLFSSTLKAIQFTTPNGISKQFIALNNIITEWQNYLQEHPFKEKLINGNIVERVTDKLNLYLDGYKEKFKKIYDKQQLRVDLNDITNVADKPYLPIQLNDKYINKTLNPSKKERIKFTSQTKELYNFANENLPYYTNWQLKKEIYPNILDNLYFNNYTLFNDKFYLIDEDKAYKFNKQNGRLLPHRSNLITYDFAIYEQIYKPLKDSFIIHHNDISFDQYKTKDDNIISFNNDLIDKFYLKYSQDNLQLNKNNNKFISHNIEQFILSYWYKDKYDLEIKDSLLVNIDTPYIEHFILNNENKIYWGHDSADTFYLKYSQNNNLILNKDNGKFISHNIEKFDLSYWYNEKYDTISIKDLLLTYSLHAKEAEKYKKLEEYITANNIAKDKYELYDDENVLQLNKKNGKFISYRTAIYSLLYWYNDKYHNITDKIIYNVSYTGNEKFNKLEELYIVDNQFDDIYELFDEDNNEYLRLNDVENNDNLHTNALVSNKLKLLYGKHRLNSILSNIIRDEKYNVGTDNLIYNIDYTEIEKYKELEELYTISNYLKDKYELYDDENNLQLNKKNGKFITRKTAIYSLAPWYNDKYQFNIIDNLIAFHFNNIENEYYQVKEELYIVNNFLSDKYEIYDEDDLLQLNKNDGRFISKYSHKYYFGYIYNDKYKFDILDNIMAFNFNDIEDEYYQVKKELPIYCPVLSDKYEIYNDDNLLQLNKHNGKLVSKYSHKYYFGYTYNDKYNSNIKSIVFANLETPRYREEFKIATQPVSIFNPIYSDKYETYNDENNLQLNKNNGKFINTFIEKFTLNYLYSEAYEFINNSDIINIYTLYNEYFNIDKYDDYQLNNIYNFNKELNIFYPQDRVSINNNITDKYNIIDEDIDHSYNQSIYTEKINDIEDHNSIQTEEQETYFDLNKDIRLLQFNTMQLNNSKFFTTSNEIYTTIIDGAKEQFNKVNDEDASIIDITDLFNKPTEEIIEKIDLNEDSMYNRIIHPFQFSISKFNNRTFLYKHVIDHMNIKLEHIEKYKPILALNHVNLQYHEFIHKAKEKCTTQNNSYYNEIYNKYRELNNTTKDIMVNDREHYQLLSTVAYMQIEKLINNKYMIIRKNSYV